MTDASGIDLLDLGASSPLGALLRRQWIPFLPAGELDAHAVLPVRLLGEGLVSYRDLSGTVGLIGDLCGHDLVNMKWGYPDDHGLRCCYHHWCYDETGQCTEMPFEHQLRAEDEHIAGYPVREQGGLLFAYLGAGPPPELPTSSVFVPGGEFRSATYRVLDRSWLECLTTSPPWTEGEAEEDAGDTDAPWRPLRHGEGADGPWRSHYAAPLATRVEAPLGGELWVHVPINRTHTLRLVYASDGPGLAASEPANAPDKYIADLDIISAYARIVDNSPPEPAPALAPGHRWLSGLLEAMATSAAPPAALDLDAVARDS